MGVDFRNVVTVDNEIEEHMQNLDEQQKIKRLVPLCNVSVQQNVLRFPFLQLILHVSTGVVVLVSHMAQNVFVNLTETY